jgi:hypothetical protein
LLGISERTFRRWRDRHRDSGPAGLDDRRQAPSIRRAPVVEIERMLGLYRDLYRGFTVKHFHEQLGKRHNYTLGYTVTKVRNVSTTLIQPGLEFKLWCSALVQWLCGWWHVGLRAEVQAVQGSGDRRAWVPHSVT